MKKFQFSLLLIFCLLLYSDLFSQQLVSTTILNSPRENAEWFISRLKLTEIPVYDLSPQKGVIHLENGYASPVLKNTQLWSDLKGKARVKSIRIVYTKYPFRRPDWITNYYDLLAARLKAIFALDSSLNRSDIEWQLVMQTNCKNGKEAQKMWHGVVIEYEIINTEVISENKNKERNDPYWPDTLRSTTNPRYIMLVQGFVSTYGKNVEDKSVFTILERTRGWNSTVVVMDWTASMYEYGSQAVLWQMLNNKISPIKHYVFFNDGNGMKDDEKKTGQIGGIYYVNENDHEMVLNTMHGVIEMGKGGDWQENNIEALLGAVKKYPDAKSLIMISDNRAPIRDMVLLDSIKIPVHVVVGNVPAISDKDYIEVAYRTQGSYHTTEKDYYNLQELFADSSEVIDGVTYILLPGDIIEKVGLQFKEEGDKEKIVPLNGPARKTDPFENPVKQMECPDFK